MTKSAIEAGIVRAKNARQKRKMQKAAPKVFENTKQTMLVKGGNVSQTLTNLMHDLNRLKQPNCIMYKKKNIVRPFEDVSKIEFFSQKCDASLFAFGSHNKKRPDNLVIGRMFDHQLLDMVEFGVANYSQMSGKCPIPQGTKPVLSFAGDQWEAESETVDYPLVRNLLLDFYRGETAKSIRLKGLELFIQFTLVNDVIAMRTYQVKLVKSGMDQPRVELESIGPDMDLTIRRKQFANTDLRKKAMKQPAETKVKRGKNKDVDPLTGEVRGTVHIPGPRQDFEKLKNNTKKQRALTRAMPEKEIDSEDEAEFEQDIEMEEVE